MKMACVKILPPVDTPPMVERSKAVKSQAMGNLPRTRTAKGTYNYALVTKDGNKGFNERNII